MLPISKKISPFNFSRENYIKYIVIHDVGTKSTAKNNVDYFFGGDRQSSAHYFVDDTSIWQSVEENHGAWHCGDGHGKYGITNTNSIGVEMCLPSGTVTTKTEENTIELVKNLQAKYGVDNDHIVRHYDASRKNCPAQFNLDGKWARWSDFKKKLSTTPSKPSGGVSGTSAGDGQKNKKRGNVMLLFKENGKIYWWAGNAYTYVSTPNDLARIKEMMTKAGYDTWEHTNADQIKYIKRIATEKK